MLAASALVIGTEDGFEEEEEEEKYRQGQKERKEEIVIKTNECSNKYIESKVTSGSNKGIAIHHQPVTKIDISKKKEYDGDNNDVARRKME
eukprot:15350455-Ditylum_brightwellii.AAC.1